MTRKESVEALSSYFGNNHGTATLEQLRDHFRISEPNIPDATVNWRIHDLVDNGALRRVGRGLFEPGSEIVYTPELPSRAIKISKSLKKNFPFISFCVWSSDLLNEFAQHISSYPFLLVDVEKDVAESVYYRLNDEFGGVFLRPAETIINDLLPNFRLPLVIRHLVSESPLNQVNGLSSVSLEKLLVDAFCDPEFRFLEGSELRAVFSNAFYKYTVNENKLLRYAARKGRKPELAAYLRDGNFIRSTAKPN